MRRKAAFALVSSFSRIFDRRQAWNDIIQLLQDEDRSVRAIVAGTIGTTFPLASDRRRAWEDLHGMTRNKHENVRIGVAGALGSIFPSIPNQKQAHEDLILLTKDKNKYVRALAYHSLGKVSIYRATEAESEEIFREDFKNALDSFEKSLKEAAYFNPPKFCYPFYRSFYTITFKKYTPESEVQKYLAEAKRATEGSESRAQLLEAIENLANALKEVQNAREMDFDIMKRNLEVYRRYCDRAADLLDTTEKKAPGATKLIRKGLPIIDQRIKEILGEIQEKTADVCKETKGTPLENLGYEINQIGKNLLLVRDPIGLERQVEVMEVTISSICDKMSQDEREDACKLLKRAKLEPHAEDKLLWFNTILSKIPAQLRKMKEEYEEQKRDEIPYSSELESEFSDIFKSVYQKEREKGESDVNSKTLTFLKTKLHDLSATKRPFKWLEVGCGYGRALDVLDAVTVPRDMFEYHGTDAVHKYLDEAEEQARKHKLVNPKIEKMDAAHMDFNSEFDLVSAVLLLHEIDPLCLPYVIRNMIRALKTEGTLVISDFQGPYEQEEGIVAWSADDIKFLLEYICEEAKVSFEPIPAGKYPKELGFYACYVKKSNIDDTKFETFMGNYNEFLKQKKTESKELRNELRRQLKERVTKILGRSDIDTKNISDEEMEKIKGAIKDEYGIKAHKIRLLTNQIEFLDDKIEEFNSGKRCAGVD